MLDGATELFRSGAIIGLQLELFLVPLYDGAMTYREGLDRAEALGDDVDGPRPRLLRPEVRSAATGRRGLLCRVTGQHHADGSGPPPATRSADQLDRSDAATCRWSVDRHEAHGRPPRPHFPHLRVGRYRRAGHQQMAAALRQARPVSDRMARGFPVRMSSCYLAVKADHGMWLTTITAGLARLARAQVFLHHHSYTYIRERKSRMVALVRVAGPPRTSCCPSRWRRIFAPPCPRCAGPSSSAMPHWSTRHCWSCH